MVGVALRLVEFYIVCGVRCTRLQLLAQWFFFFQAEDGIRDLVRSRGLGDVYKRQVYQRAQARQQNLIMDKLKKRGRMDQSAEEKALEPVSYTHLTLPTSDLV